MAAPSSSASEPSAVTKGKARDLSDFQPSSPGREELACPPPPTAQELPGWRRFYSDHHLVLEYFVAGGAAGAASRTAVSPIERLKILMQVQSGSGRQQYTGIWSGLAKMWREEGIRGYMKGNGINCARIMPYSAVQFSTYESMKTFLSEKGHLFGGEPGSLGTGLKLLAGSTAGIASVTSTYPLDLVRARLSIISARATSPEGSLGMLGMTRKVYAEEGGLRGLYRGCIPTAAGVAPYVALNFVFYESLRKHFLRPPEEGGLLSEAHRSEGEVALVKLLCGTIAGGTSQTITYPFDVIRRKMQVLGLQRAKTKPALSASSIVPIAVPSLSPSTSASSSSSGNAVLASARALSTSSALSVSSLAPSPPPPPKPYTYTTGTGALLQIYQREGVKGLYRGIGPNIVKVAPSMGISFLTYETVLSLLHGEDEDGS